MSMFTEPLSRCVNIGLRSVDFNANICEVNKTKQKNKIIFVCLKRPVYHFFILDIYQTYHGEQKRYC